MMRFLPLLLAVLWVGPASAAYPYYPWYTIPDNIRGAHLMTQEERSNHIYRLQNMKTFDECKRYMQQHYIELERRAMSQRIMLPPIQVDPCEMMRMTGYFR
jgi:hypothetical protein